MTSGFYPLFTEVACELKELMDRGGGSPHVLAAYIFGYAWSHNTGGVFTPDKSEMSRELCLTRDTVRKYLSELTEFGYLTEVNGGTAYIISKSVRYRFTITAEKPTPSDAMKSDEHVVTPPPDEHVVTLTSMSSDFDEHVVTSASIDIDSIENNNMTRLQPSKSIDLSQVKEIWKHLNLDSRALPSMLNHYEGDLQELTVLSATWLDWWLQVDESEHIEPALLNWRIKNRMLPPEVGKQKTWFDDAPLGYFDNEPDEHELLSEQVYLDHADNEAIYERRK